MPQAVRPNDAHTAPPRDLDHLLLHAGPLPAGLGKPAGDDDSSLDPLADTVMHNVDNTLKGDRNYD